MSCFLRYTEQSERRCCTKDTMVAGFPLAQNVELPLFASFVLKYVLGSKGTVPKSSVAQLPVVAVHSLLFLTFYTVNSRWSVAGHHSGVQERLGALIIPSLLFKAL